MNTVADLRPEVTAFVNRVLDRLADLSEEEREELVGGLEADLSEQLADGGVVVLPDPASYAAELRAAAGLPEPRRTVRFRGARPPTRPLSEWPDALRGRWLAQVERHEAARHAWRFLEVIRPAWWVLRAWIAVTWLDQLTGPSEPITILPSFDVAGLGLVLLLGAVVVSVLMGQGRLWPGSGPDRRPLARFVLAGLTVLAVLVPATFQWPAHGNPDVVFRDVGYGRGYHAGTHRPGLRLGTDVVRNIYAYNAKGKLVVGAQLFDQQGRPVAVAPVSSMGRGKTRQVTCPWYNGATPLYNVYPLPQRVQRRGTCLTAVGSRSAGTQALRTPPFASVPPATLPATAATQP